MISPMTPDPTRREPVRHDAGPYDSRSDRGAPRVVARAEALPAADRRVWLAAIVWFVAAIGVLVLWASISRAAVLDPVATNPEPTAAPRGALLDRVVSVLERRFYDREFRRDHLPELAAAAREAVRGARDFAEERAVIHEFLAQIPVSHLGLLSADSYRTLMAELSNRTTPTLGFGLVRTDRGYFVSSVLEGGPAERAGLLRGDRVVAVDEVPTGRSPRLDWRTDDAALPDPPKHRLTCDADDVVRLTVERRPDEYTIVTVRAARDSAFRATERSVRVVEHRRKRFGVVHFWYMHHEGLAPLLREAFETRFADCDALVLDLRGRGGSTLSVMTVLAVLDWAKREWKRPVVALIDSGTRSAKEILAYEIRKQGLGTLIGETTPGAVIPATFRDVGSGAVLMFPAYSLGRYTSTLEGKGVAPDVLVRDRLEYAQGRDAIFEGALRHLSQRDL